MTGASSLVFDIGQKLPTPLHCVANCEPGQLLAIVGPSGAGKTSVLRVLAGLMRPEQGRIHVGDEIWFDSERGIHVPTQRRHVGLVFQNYALMPHLDATYNVALSLMHLPVQERINKAREWLSHVKLSHEQQLRRPYELSGGQQQRVAVARALAREPRLLLLDEPFSAVDQMTRQGLYQLMADMRKELHIPIVLVTHDLHEAALMADRMVVMDAGQVLQTGTPSMIHRSPRNARVADLVGIQNRFRGQWLGPSDEPGWGNMQWVGVRSDPELDPVLKVIDKGKIKPGQFVSWVIPGDGIDLQRPEAESCEAFDSVVVQTKHLGEITLAQLALGESSSEVLNVIIAGRQRRQVKEGEMHRVYLDRSMIHVMPLRS